MNSQSIIFKNCWYKLPQMEWLSKQIIILSQFCKLEVWNKDVDRIVLITNALEKFLSCLF